MEFLSLKPLAQETDWSILFAYETQFSIFDPRGECAGRNRRCGLIRQLGEDSDTRTGRECHGVTEGYVLHYLSGTDRRILLAQRGDDVQGLLSYSVRADLYHAGHSVLIEELVVDENCRGQGIGGALMDALMERLPALECREVCLAVMPENKGAIRFYKKHGLVEEALFLERHFPFTS